MYYIATLAVLYCVLWCAWDAKRIDGGRYIKKKVTQDSFVFCPFILKITCSGTLTTFTRTSNQLSNKRQLRVLKKVVAYFYNLILKSHVSLILLAYIVYYLFTFILTNRLCMQSRNQAVESNVEIGNLHKIIIINVTLFTIKSSNTFFKQKKTSITNETITFCLLKLVLLW